nr:RHS repeat-associated core domain-containing protein [Ligaoa zhengdingensis]
MKEISNSGTAGASLQVSASEPVEFDATVTEYDVWNRQVKVTNDAGTSSYAYYPDGLRYSKTVNGALLRQVWDGTNLAYEYTLGEEDAVVPVRRYARGINAIYVESGDAKNYYLYNAHGDVVQLTDATGIVTQEYEYDAFGNEQNPSANDTNPMRYCGEYFDAETGTIYLRARYYDPRIGRFTSADTVLQVMRKLGSGIEVPDPLSLNRYTYCHNNPVMYMDSTGNFVISTTVLLVAAGAAIVGTIGGFVGNYIADQKGATGWEKAGYIAGGAVIGAVAGGVAGYVAAPAVASATGVAAISVTSAGVATISANGIVATNQLINTVPGVQQGLYTSLEQGVNFSRRALEHMQEPGRFVPVQSLIDTIKIGASMPDPQGSQALMYYAELSINSKLYNLEVLYDKFSNTIWHFKYYV